MLRSAILKAAKRSIRKLASTPATERIVRLVAEEYAVAQAARGARNAESYLRRVLGDRVIRGPFKGMRYPSFRSAGSSFWPKILGAYEVELQPLLEQLLKEQYEAIIDIGAAEGYYAVGLAQRVPTARIIAFEMSPDARLLLEQMASANGVSNSVTIKGACNQQALRECLGEIGDRKSLVICDAETAEYEIFKGDIGQHDLRRADLLVELHASSLVHDPLEWMRKHFGASHSISHVPAQPRISTDFPELDGLLAEQRRAVLFERTDNWGWVLCRPN